MADVIFNEKFHTIYEGELKHFYIEEKTRENRYEAEVDQLEKVMKKRRITERRTEYQPDSEEDEPSIDIQRGYSAVSRPRRRGLGL